MHGFLYNGGVYTTLSVPSATFTNPQAIDGNNIVGAYDDTTGEHGFLYNGSTYTTIDPPGSSSTQAYGISGGNVVGQFSDGHTEHAFLYNGSGYTTLDPPGSIYTSAFGVSGNNVAGIYYYDVSGVHAFQYDGSGYTLLVPPGATQAEETAVSGNNVFSMLAKTLLLRSRRAETDAVAQMLMPQVLCQPIFSSKAIACSGDTSISWAEIRCERHRRRSFASTSLAHIQTKESVNG